MARFFAVSDPEIERHFAMLDAGAARKHQEESWEHMQGAHSMGGYYLDSRNAPDRMTVDRASESSHGGIRPRSDSSRKRWPFGRSFGAALPGVTYAGGSSPHRREWSAATIVDNSHSGGGGCGGGGDRRTNAGSKSCASAQPYYDVTARDSLTASRLSVSTAVPATCLKSASRQESPTSPFMLAAGRSLSASSGDSSTRHNSASAESATSAASTNCEHPVQSDSIQNIRGKDGVRSVKVIFGANPAAVELYLHRKAQERARATTRHTPVVAAVAAGPAPR